MIAVGVMVVKTTSHSAPRPASVLSPKMADCAPTAVCRRHKRAGATLTARTIAKTRARRRPGFHFAPNIKDSHLHKTISVTGRLLASAAIGGIALFVGAAGLLSGQGEAQAASPACTNAPFHATPEVSIGTAFVDVGVGNKATFVCVTSTAFTGGSSNEVTVNGPLANGCFVVQGIGTSVVAVFWEQPSIRPDCATITGIDVGFQSGTGATATAPPSTATAPAATATPRPATTATVAPATPVPATAVPATPTRPAPVAPRTGSGPGEGGSSLPILLGGGALVLAALAFAGFRQRQGR